MALFDNHVDLAASGFGAFHSEHVQSTLPHTKLVWLLMSPAQQQSFLFRAQSEPVQGHAATESEPGTWSMLQVWAHEPYQRAQVYGFVSKSG